MKKLLLLCLLILTSAAHAQEREISFTAGNGNATRIVYVGLDPAATDGLDADLGEQELPPLPPSDVFEARFVGAQVAAELGQGSYRDYRNGDAGFEGEVEHQLQWQLGDDSSFTLGYDLPDNVTARVEDFFGGAVLSEEISGAGQLEITNSALTQVKITMVYVAGGPVNAAPAFTSAAVTEASVDAVYAYDAAATDADGDALTLSAPTLPEWLTFTGGGDGTGTLEGTPTVAGDYDVVLEAGDGTTTTQQSFTITVSEAASGAALDLAFSAGDGVSSLPLHAGLDPNATAGFDSTFGERELPPLPPSGVFEARFVGAQVAAELGQGSYRDYRTGDAGFEGEVEHQLQWQLGDGSSFTLGYDLPDNVTARVEDFFGGAVLSEEISGAGRLEITNSALTQVRLTMVYAAAGEPGNTAPTFTSTVTTEATVGAAYAYDVAATDADDDGLTLSAPTLPEWLTFTDGGDGTGTLEGTPMATGDYDVVLEAGDGTTTTQQSFTVTVTEATGGAALDLALTVSDGVDSLRLHAGLDPNATNNLDDDLGERELPPLPPSGVFEARFVGDEVDTPLGQGSYRDYRTGDANFEGEVEHQLRWQLGDGSSFTLGYDLPDNVTARVEDFFGGAVLSDTLTGAGRLVITNAALTQVRLTMSYAQTVDVDDAGRLPRAFTLRNAYPNPFRTRATLRYELPQPARVRLTVHDVLGRQVAVLVDGEQQPGSREVHFDAAAQLPAGLYFVRMQAGSEVAVRRLVRVR